MSGSAASILNVPRAQSSLKSLCSFSGMVSRMVGRTADGNSASFVVLSGDFQKEPFPWTLWIFPAAAKAASAACTVPEEMLYVFIRVRILGSLSPS